MGVISIFEVFIFNFTCKEHFRYNQSMKTKINMPMLGYLNLGILSLKIGEPHSMALM